MTNKRSFDAVVRMVMANEHSFDAAACIGMKNERSFDVLLCAREVPKRGAASMTRRGLANERWFLAGRDGEFDGDRDWELGAIVPLVEPDYARSMR